MNVEQLIGILELMPKDANVLIEKNDYGCCEIENISQTVENEVIIR